MEPWVSHRKVARRSRERNRTLFFFITDKARAKGRAKKPVRMGPVRLLSFLSHYDAIYCFFLILSALEIAVDFLYALRAVAVATRWSPDHL
jgi:hypothetical protein